MKTRMRVKTAQYLAGILGDLERILIHCIQQKLSALTLYLAQLVAQLVGRVDLPAT